MICVQAARLQRDGFSAEAASAAVASSRSSLDGSGKLSSESHLAQADSKKMSLTGVDGVTRTSQLLNTNQYSKAEQSHRFRNSLHSHHTNTRNLS